MGYLAKSLSMFLYSYVYGSLHDVLFNFPERDSSITQFITKHRLIQESLADAKVLSARQQCMYEGP